MDCSVIIPVGPGHEEAHKDAVSSVHIASHNKGLFDKINIIVVDDTKEPKGRSHARNQGVSQSNGEWVFFLDADDLMAPLAFESASGAIDNDADAVFGSIWEYQNGLVFQRFQIPFIGGYDDLLQYDPYLTLQMGHFVRTEIAESLPFNTEMNCGEDWDYYLKLWHDYECEKIEEPLFYNRRGMHSTGPKSATGAQWTETVRKMLDEARK